MKKSILMALAFLFGIFVSASFAVDVNMFGPKQYVRTKGAPNVYTDTFSALPKEGRLGIKNGEEDGKHR
ncbi:MAG: hypothetical protein JRC68_09405, partial [Deltaproteobacteria bacterium]|nr:hypothetical protein [Deltaproteobacteria bacterium]